VVAAGAAAVAAGFGASLRAMNRSATSSTIAIENNPIDM
jgi:hypothetical protein